ncbi:hypothetical protein BurJ1DRAFT_2372 [Burkholderiales bacterium JOSHI_001]|nr:hypothetical protein BurJ1DRAFT_2372 [Burkholderiales bacterium JOSHI_001]
MDADTAADRQFRTPPGGTVEPANRATVAKERFQTPAEQPGERYELRDPFAEVTYRASTFADIVAKADQLGSTRMVAVGTDGKRTPVNKVNGVWQRETQALAPHQAQPAPTATREGKAPAAKDAAAEQTLRQAAPHEPPDTQAMAKLEAQAERAAQVARLEAALMERYVIKRAPVTVGDVTIGRTEYRFRGDTTRVAFTESTFRLATDTNSPSVARSMVDVAEARNWKALRVSGNADFRRLVWLEASVRGVRTIGYEPNPADLELLKGEREARQQNRIEPAVADSPAAATTATDKATGRGSGGRKAVLAAIEAVLVAKRVPEKQREAILAAATDKLAQRIRDGQVPKVRVYDKAAPSQRPAVVPTPEKQRTREQAAPTR